MSQAVFEGQAGSYQGSGRPLGINTKFVTTDFDLTDGNNSISAKNFEDPEIAKEEREKQKYNSRRDFRSWLSMRQRFELYRAGHGGAFKSLCNCGRFAVPETGKKPDGSEYATGSPGQVQVAWYEASDPDKALAYTWVKKCASPMFCFECAPKIHYVRSMQLQQISKTLYRRGYSWQFWTFTAPHGATTDPCVQVELFRDALRELKKDRRWKLFKQRTKLKYTVTVVEFTDDGPDSNRKSGCHFHSHVMPFFECEEFSEDEVEEMRVFLSRRWVQCLLKVGLITEDEVEKSLKYAFRLDVPRKPRKKVKRFDILVNAAAAKEAAKSAKSFEKARSELSDEEIERISEYMAKGASCELTPGIFTKNCRIAGRISHWNLMALALTTRPELIPRMLAVMRALKGRQWLRFSPGLLEDCGLKEVKDEEILKEENAPVVTSFDPEDWEAVTEYKSNIRLLRQVAADAADSGIDLTARPAVQKGVFLPSVTVERVEGTVIKYKDVIIDGYDPITGEVLSHSADPPSWVRRE